VIGRLLARAWLVALLAWAIRLLCPLVMLLMMRGSHHGPGRDHRDHQADHSTPPTTRVAGGR
jgi:DUF2933 family protein